MRMLARVEGMPLESLQAGVPWDWRTFGEYLDRLDGTLAVNAGFLVGHSALRRVVMGEAASTDAASPEQLDRMRALLDESLAAGGLGFSSSQAPTHNDANGIPVPSRFATAEELVALSRVVRDHPGTTLEFIPAVGGFEDKHVELMADMSLAADRPLNWNVLGGELGPTPGPRSAARGIGPRGREGRTGPRAHRARRDAHPPVVQVGLHPRRAPRGGRPRWRWRPRRSCTRCPTRSSGPACATRPRHRRPGCSARSHGGSA